MEVAAGDRGLADGDRDLVEAADDVPDGVEAVDGGHLVFVDEHFLRVGEFSADVSRELRSGDAAHEGIDGVEGERLPFVIPPKTTLSIEPQLATKAVDMNTGFAGLLHFRVVDVVGVGWDQMHVRGVAAQERAVARDVSQATVHADTLVGRFVCVTDGTQAHRVFGDGVFDPGDFGQTILHAGCEDDA